MAHSGSNYLTSNVVKENQYSGFFSDEASKLQQHLTLLRSEYVKLQSRLHQMEKSAASNSSSDGGGGEFASRLLKAVANMHDGKKYRYNNNKFFFSWCCLVLY